MGEPYAAPRDIPTFSADKQRDFQPFLRRANYIEKLARKLQEARAEREQAAEAVLERLGLLAVHPLDGGFQALDLLSCVTVEGVHWIWTGCFNGKGTPVLYPHAGQKRTYHGAANLVHYAVIGCHHQRAYQPRCGEQRCVRPSHRCSACESNSPSAAGAARLDHIADRDTVAATR